MAASWARPESSAASSAAMPSAGVMAPTPCSWIRRSRSSRAAAPISAHAPQLMLSAGRPAARRWCASASRYALAAAWLPWPGEPSSEATEEKRTKKSSSSSRVSACSDQPPATFAPMTRAKRDQSLLQERAVVEDAGRVEDAAQRRQGRAHLARGSASTSPCTETSPRITLTCAPSRAQPLDGGDAPSGRARGGPPGPARGRRARSASAPPRARDHRGRR